MIRIEAMENIREKLDFLIEHIENKDKKINRGTVSTELREIKRLLGMR